MALPAWTKRYEQKNIQESLYGKHGPSESAPPSQQSSTSNPINPLPFMAQDNANIKTFIGTQGTEPIYYSGRPREGLTGTYDAVIGNPLKNWFRRTWGKINDPYQMLPTPTAEQRAEIDRRAQEMQTNIPSAAAWLIGPNGEQTKAFEEFTGLDMQSIYQTMATRQVAKEENGAVPMALEDIKNIGGQVASTAIFGVLGAAEWVSRQSSSVVKSIDDTADQAAGADGSVADGVVQFLQANYQRENAMSTMLNLPPYEQEKDPLKFLKVVEQVLPIEIFKDIGRLVLNLDKVNKGQFTSNLNANLAGSQMIYSMMSDEATKEAYKRRYEDGESPQKLVMELQDPTMELMGGILLDFTTWISAPAKVYKQGLRVLDDAVKSASQVKVFDMLTDIRAPETIKTAIKELQQVAEGSSPKTSQEILDSINGVVNKVKTEFDTWKNTRNITSLVSTGKQEKILEDGKNFLGSMASIAVKLPDGMDRMTETVRAMINMSKGVDVQKAASTLASSPFGETVLSPRAMRLSNMMADVSDELPAIAKAISEGDVSKLANVYAAQIEKYANNSIQSVTEMAEIADKVKRGVDVTPEMIKTAGEYNALPAATKFVNGLNELGKRTWMKPMSFLANVYFGLNRFSYPTRNVISAIPGMGFEVGFADAAEVAFKSITGAQVEKLGINMLETTTKEIERLVGFIPGAATRGNSPIGQFLDTSKKYLGVIRGGGEVAQLSEKIMGSNIVLLTIKRELKNALKYGAIPETGILEKAGLSPKDAQALVSYTMEHGGDSKKVLDSFRKFMGGTEESFRHIPMSDRLQGFLDHIDNGETSVYRELDNALKNAQSVDEWRAAADAAWKKMEGLGEFSRTEPAKLSEDIPESVFNEIREAQMLKTVSPEGIDDFQRVVQASRNAKNKFAQVEESMKSYLYNLGGQMGIPFDKMFSSALSDAKTSSDALERADAVRNLVNKIRNNKELTTSEMYDALNSLEDFKISNLTDIDPSKVSRKEMESIMWEGYYAWKGKFYADKMNGYVSSVTAIFESMAAQAGTTVADAARASGAPFQEAVDTVDDTYKFLMQQQVDVMSFTRRFTPDGATLADVSIDAAKQAGYNSLSHLFNTVNKYRRSVGDTAYSTFEQVPMWEVQDAARRLKRSQGFIPANPSQDMLTGAYDTMLHAPITGDQAVTPSRMIYESLPKAKGDFTKYVEGIASRWGEVSTPAGSLSDEVERALGGWTSTLDSRMSTAQNEAAMTASATRDALLYDYRKTLGNVAGQYISPFHYYSLSASNQWLKNVAADPKWGAIYIDYKESRAQQFAGLPDYWKQNIAISGLPGTDPTNPMFFNIEASVNPIYQMISADYNNPERRADWLSSTVDSLSKIVPGLYQPLQWVVAANLYANGEDEAARQWIGRLIPQTKLIKSVTNALGINIPGTKFNELDPFVGILQDGLDPSEEKRALKFLATMSDIDGQPITEEMRITAAHERSGPIWDQAVRDSLSGRAGADAASYFLGVGYKPRTKNDIVIENFQQDYRKLIASRSLLSEDAYTASWSALREKYPFMDTMLIGRRAGEDRDTAFNYNVLGRIPPGQLSDISEFVGIKPYMIEQFYSSKGDMSGWTESDKLRFNAAMLDLSAMLTMPDGATRTQWKAAKDEYKEMQEGMKAEFGENILDQISTYYDLTDGEREDYLSLFPQVEIAMQAQTAYTATNPILAPYYSSLNTVNRYESNKMYEKLEQEFGNDIVDKADYYYYLKDNDQEAEAKAYHAQENLKAYFARKVQLQQEANINVANSASNLPDNGEFNMRPDFAPQSGIQTDAMNYATGPSQNQQIAAEAWEQLSPATQNLVQDYYRGQDLPYSVEKRIDRVAREYGLSKDELLRLFGTEVLQ